MKKPEIAMIDDLRRDFLQQYRGTAEQKIAETAFDAISEELAESLIHVYGVGVFCKIADAGTGGSVFQTVYDYLVESIPEICGNTTLDAFAKADAAGMSFFDFIESEVTRMEGRNPKHDN